MMKIFRKGGQAVTTAVDVLTDTVEEVATADTPLHSLPNVPAEHTASIGEDINLPLLVKELGGRKKLTLERRRKEITAELEKIDKELTQLHVLLEAANSL